MVNLQGTGTESQMKTSITPGACVQWGFVGGLVGTLVMDVVLMVGLAAAKLPADSCYLAIGRTAAHFFSIFGVKFSGEASLGVAVYHILGPSLGAVYGLIVSRITALQQTSLKKSLLFAVLYAEIVSQLILALIPVLLKLPVEEAILWFAGSAVLHSTWGVVMGLAIHYMVLLMAPSYRKPTVEKMEAYHEK